MSDFDFDGAADIAAAIQAAGGRIQDFDAGKTKRQPRSALDFDAMLNPIVPVYQFSVVIPGGTTRDVDVDDDGDDETVQVLASLLEASDGMPVDEGMTPAQNLRAVVGQADIDLAKFREAYLDVYDEPPTGWDIGPPADDEGDEDQTTDIDIE